MILKSFRIPELLETNKEDILLTRKQVLDPLPGKQVSEVQPVIP